MDQEIIVAGLALVVAWIGALLAFGGRDRRISPLRVVGSLSGTYFANRRATALIAYRLEQLEKKVNQHNSVIERQYELEKKFAEHERDYAAACRRLEELEKGA